MDPKEVAGRKAAEYVNDGMVVGLGTGSTAVHLIRALGERVAKGLKLQAIPTSEASARLAEKVGIELISLEENPVVDLTIDGADEVDPTLQLVKGLGGALLREKIVAAASTHRIIIVDPSKLVTHLGAHAPLPVEVVPFGWPVVRRFMVEEKILADLRLRPEGDEPFVTDNGNFILDCRFPQGIPDPAKTESWLNRLPGVVENGLFVNLADLVIVGHEDGTCRLMERR
jgi:ribose 5-phosphate isomerase A